MRSGGELAMVPKSRVVRGNLTTVVWGREIQRAELRTELGGRSGEVTTATTNAKVAAMEIHDLRRLRLPIVPRYPDPYFMH
jgi:hypothetical protein